MNKPNGGGPTMNQNVTVPVKAGPAPMGNANAITSGQGPGAGRTIHRSGSQSSTPEAAPMPPSDRWALWPDKEV